MAFAPMVEESIVKPIKHQRTPNPGQFAILVSTQADIQLSCNILDIHPAQSRRLYISHLYAAASAATDYCVVGPLIGAPYAVMLLETLAAWGTRRFVFWGWCGAIAPDVKVGDVIVPDSAIIDEGTSTHYSVGRSDVSIPSPDMTAVLKERLNRRAIDFREGPVWTTDAIFRETPGKVKHHQRRGALAVEMELSALYSAAAFLDVEMGAVLVVSDELSSLTWTPGFNAPRFKQCRQSVCRCLKDLIDAVAE